MKEFAFDVVTTSRVTIRSDDARRARQELKGALNKATARVVDGPGVDDLEMTRVQMVGLPGLVSIDGRDPVAEIRRLLQAHRSGPAERSPGD